MSESKIKSITIYLKSGDRITFLNVTMLAEEDDIVLFKTIKQGVESIAIFYRSSIEGMVKEIKK